MAATIRQEGIDSLYRHAYSIQQKFLNLTSTQCKVNTLVVLGRMLEVGAAGGCVLAFGLAVTSNPLCILWSVPAIFAGIVGMACVDAPERVLDTFIIDPPYVPGQPLGLINSGNNCWLNSALQILVNSPSLQAKTQRIPELANFFTQYQAENRPHRPVRYLETQRLREYFSRQTAGQIASCYTQQDPAELFEFIFQGDGALHTLYQQIGDGLPSLRREPLIEVELEGGGSFQELFNRYFDHQVDGGARMRLSFESAPAEMLVKAKRVGQGRDPVTGNSFLKKNNDPLNLQPTLQLSADKVRSGGAAQYRSNGFLVHYGASCNSGHYVAYIKRDDKWWYISDRSIRQVSEQNAHHAMKDAYILHFKK